jgi:hypothetical protein
MRKNTVFIWIILLNIMISRYTHFPENDKILFFVVAELYSIVYAEHILFFYSLSDGHIGWFHYPSIVNIVAINMGVHVSILYADFYSFKYMFRSDTV